MEYNVREYAKLKGVSKYTVYLWIKLGKVKWKKKAIREEYIIEE